MKIKIRYIDFPPSSQYKNGESELEFTANELLHAAYTVGKESWEDVYKYPYYSEREIEFRISMVQAFLKLDGEYIKRSELFYGLDPSEKTSINYFFGMIFCNLVMQKKFHVRWLIHLDLFKGEIDIGKQQSRPDFVGKTKTSSWIAIEAKGLQRKTKSTVNNAIEQARKIISVDNKPPLFRLASILYGGKNKNLEIDIIDPEKAEGLDLLLDKRKRNYARDYYSLVFNIIRKNHDTIWKDGRMFAVRDLTCEQTIIGLDYYLFERLEELPTSYITKDFEEYLKKWDEEYPINDEKDYFIGQDGVYISYYGKIDKIPRNYNYKD